MDIKDNFDAEVLIKVLPYIQQYKGKTIVIKYGGNAMINEDLKNAVINDLVLLSFLGLKVVLIHGGGPDINTFLNKVGKECEFVNGLRVTDDETMEVVQMVLSGKVNKDIVSLINKNGGKAIGLSGIDSYFLKAEKKLSDDGADLGFVGKITCIDEKILLNLLDGDYIPVVSTIAVGEIDHKAYNINADYAACKIAAKLKSEKLILLTDVPGILSSPGDEDTLLKELHQDSITKLKNNGIIQGGMIPKVDCCLQAIKEGVKSAHIIDGRIKNSILYELFSDETIGTVIS